MQIDPGADIVFQLHLKVARNIAFEQTKTIISCANRVCLLNDQLSALVESLQGAGNRECQQQSYQGEYGALRPLQELAEPQRAAIDARWWPPLFRTLRSSRSIFFNPVCHFAPVFGEAQPRSPERRRRRSSRFIFAFGRLLTILFRLRG